MKFNWVYQITINLLAAFLYLAFGLVSTGLTQTPEYFTPVWMPAGIVILMASIHGKRVYPGLIIGSTIFHFYFYKDSENVVIDAMWFWQNFNYIPLILIQCISAQFILRREILNPKFHPTASSVLRIIGLSTIVALILPLFTHFYLLLDGSLPFGMAWAASLFRWWAGDFLGIISILPLVVIILISPRIRGHLRLFRYIAPISIYLLCLVVAYRSIEDREISVIEERFKTECIQNNQDLQRELESILAEADLVRIRFTRDREMPPVVFEEQMELILNRHPSIQSAHWIPVLFEADRLQKTEQIQELLPEFRGFGIRKGDDWQPIEKDFNFDFYFPISISVPLKGNESILGLDVYNSAPNLMRKIAISGNPQITAPLHLLEGPENEYGVIVYIPVEPIDLKELPSDMQTGEFGFIEFPILVEHFVGSVWNSTDISGKSIWIEDVTSNSDRIVLARLVGQDVVTQKNWNELNSVFEQTFELRVLNRIWEVSYGADRTYLQKYHSSSPLFLLVGGILVSFFLGLYLLGHYVRTQTIERTVEQRTEELVKAKIEAEQLALAKSEFLAVMSHEIRTPMNGMISTAAMLREGKLDPNQKELAEIIHLSANTLLAVINDILDFSKLEAGKTQLEAIDFDPYQLAHTVEATFRAQIKEKGLRFETIKSGSELDSSGIQLKGDMNRLLQVLMNLVSNAVKFTPEGKITVSTDVTKIDNKHAVLQIEVIDTGIGIEPTKQTELFQPFTQADISSTRKFGGSGLGLTIVKRIMDLFEGEVKMSSNPNEGSKFIVSATLPIISTTPPQSPSQIEPNESIDFTGKKILIVEDVSQNQRILQLLLRKFGVSETCASDGLEAVEACKKQQFDLILMDCRLPNMDGFEATRTIRNYGTSEWNQNVPIIALTASIYDGVQQECLEAGMDDYISKPVTLDSITNVLKTWINRKTAVETQSQ